MNKVTNSAGKRDTSMSQPVCDELSNLAAHHRAVAPHPPVHPLLLKHAAKISAGGSTSSQEAGGRLRTWTNTTRLFHITHIAKAGGRSVRREFSRLVQRPVGGAEQCYPPFVHPSRVNVVFLRHPRSHLVSMYLHGASAGRFERRRAAGYPWGNGTGGLVEGIGRWASHFGDGWTPVRRASCV